VIDYGNDKLNQIFRDTWPNLGWAKRMTHNLPDKDDAPWLDTTYDGFMTHEEMLEEAERRERVLQIARDAMEKYDEAFKELARIERAERVLERYNDYYNMECASLPHGTPITPEHQQMITLQCMIDAIRCEYLNQEYTHIAITDIEDLIEQLDEQAKRFLQRVKEFKDSADGVA
jgi:hypothetical protein